MKQNTQKKLIYGKNNKKGFKEKRGDELKLVKQKYYTASGEQKVNCYKITISKKHIERAGITETDDVEVYTEGNKIIIRKKG